jgi:Pyruvate/2-oxoacid:ferredoxin oxidoreductase delta subunit
MTHGLTIQERDANDNLTGEWRYATPDEIKAAHPKCGSCDYAVKPDPRGMTFCGNQSTILTGYAVNPTTDYCPHHQPKEQQ